MINVKKASFNAYFIDFIPLFIGLYPVPIEYCCSGLSIRYIFASSNSYNKAK